MAADSRTYIKVHDGMPDHPKIDGLSDAGFRLLVSLWCYSSRHLTDGRIPIATWQKNGTSKARSELLHVGLADHRADGDIDMHDYLEHQRSAAEVRTMKEKRRSAGQAGGLAKARASAKPLAQQTASKNVAATEVDTDLTTSLAEPPREDVEAICQHLADRINEHVSKPVRVIDSWRKDARKLLDLDKRPIDEAFQLIDWCQADSFWQPNILSMAKFRQKYEQLRLKSRSQGQKAAGQRLGPGGFIRAADPDDDAWAM